MAVTHPLQAMLWLQSGHVPAGHLPSVLISKGALGNLFPESFSFDCCYSTCADDWCDIAICAPSALAYPLLSPVALVLIDTDMKKGLCSGVNESDCLARDAFKRGQTLRGRREQLLCKRWAPTERRIRGTQALLAILGSVCAAQLTQLGPVCSYERVSFPWLVGWLLFYFQIT